MKNLVVAASRGLLWLACLCVVLILVLQVGLIASRTLGIRMLGAEAYAGYLLIAAAFLAFPGALLYGDHIRVTLLIDRLPPRGRLAIEIVCHIVGIGIAGYFSYYALRMVGFSWRFHDISSNFDATPLWIPQSVMAVGGIGLLVVLIVHLVQIIVTRRLPDPPGNEAALTVE